MLDGNIDPRGLYLAELVRIERERIAAAEQAFQEEQAKAKKGRKVSQTNTVADLTLLRLVARLSRTGAID